MRGYVVSAEFQGADGVVASGRDALAAVWGRGHEFSYLDGGCLTLVAEVQALDPAEAFEKVLSRLERLWAGLGGTPLPPPDPVRVRPVVPRERPVPGAVGRGPDRLFAEAAACTAARLRAAKAAIAELERHLP